MNLNRSCAFLFVMNQVIVINPPRKRAANTTQEYKKTFGDPGLKQCIRQTIIKTKNMRFGMIIQKKKSALQFFFFLFFGKTVNLKIPG